MGTEECCRSCASIEEGLSGLSDGLGTFFKNTIDYNLIAANVSQQAVQRLDSIISQLRASHPSGSGDWEQVTPSNGIFVIDHVAHALLLRFHAIC
ncbi:hypothetical protein K443DRAFT_12876 [Laccaria amethystina LaAM-08-1]|uniref:Uncharacterized protein n=1 Tax=Laccaria amethystina LaAM-08-1 TaxID=1095629 RepID=A0A0C9X749_9AGAR|nr:hypothetical protein K443DRAFT_12876 [Laccaria amethystina LaAM-08-1]